MNSSHPWKPTPWLRLTEESKAPPKEKKFLVGDACAREGSASSAARPDDSTHHIDTSSSSSMNEEQPSAQTTTPTTDASAMPPKSKHPPPPRRDPYPDASIVAIAGLTPDARANAFANRSPRRDFLPHPRLRPDGRRRRQPQASCSTPPATNTGCAARRK
ncbi:hypothetical protein DIS24_g6453 [Lasiodiplodia hormozganensis]|uniref:Uncharacterized protein n=1 Tax=Lasiodiplodia hormozganensis TaxID=869390 RepID=A0AA39YG04_9PEZI|nr:hypothetical protein DIS24_g6453 [Lasiodiplodia hormozganensis]